MTPERIAKFEAFIEKNRGSGTLEIALMETLKQVTELRAELSRLRSSPAPVVGGVPMDDKIPDEVRENYVDGFEPGIWQVCDEPQATTPEGGGR